MATTESTSPLAEQGLASSLTAPRRCTDIIGGAEILSASGSSHVEMLPESLIDILNSISNDVVVGMNSVGWLINVGHSHITIFENSIAGGRRHNYHDKIAAYREKLRRVA